MSNYILPLPGEVDAESPLNEALFSTRIRGTLLGLGYANSVFGTFAGSGADTTTGPTATANLDTGAAGKQYTSWNIPSGQTITLTATDGISRIGVTGTFTLGGTLTAVGKGAAGGVGGGEATDKTGVSVKYGIPNGATGGGGGGGDGGIGVAHLGGAGGTHLFNPGGAGSATEATAGFAGTAASVMALPRWYANAAYQSIGSGGGGGGSAQYGGAPGVGGAGGGVIIIECDTFVFAAGANLLSDGAAGGNAVEGGYTPGGGGGGGGGTVIVYCRVYSPGGTISANGGAGGVATGSRDGGAGGLGLYAIVVLGAPAVATT